MDKAFRALEFGELFCLKQPSKKQDTDHCWGEEWAHLLCWFFKIYKLAVETLVDNWIFFLGYNRPLARICSGFANVTPFSLSFWAGDGKNTSGNSLIEHVSDQRATLGYTSSWAMGQPPCSRAYIKAKSHSFWNNKYPGFNRKILSGSVLVLRHLRLSWTTHRYTFQMWATLGREMATRVIYSDHLSSCRPEWALKTLGSKPCQCQTERQTDRILQI